MTQGTVTGKLTGHHSEPSQSYDSRCHKKMHLDSVCLYIACHSLHFKLQVKKLQAAFYSQCNMRNPHLQFELIIYYTSGYARLLARNSHCQGFDMHYILCTVQTAEIMHLLLRALFLVYTFVKDFPSPIIDYDLIVTLR